MKIVDTFECTDCGTTFTFSLPDNYVCPQCGKKHLTEEDFVTVSDDGEGVVCKCCHASASTDHSLWHEDDCALLQCKVHS